MHKTITLASFIFPERLDWFIEYLGTKFNIPKEKIFGYQNLDDESKLIITFKMVIPEGKHLNLRNLFPNAITIHKKGNALYTINALNKLIETLVDESVGNIDYKAFKVDWDEYQNKLILIDNKKLTLLNIKRLF